MKLADLFNRRPVPSAASQQQKAPAGHQERLRKLYLEVGWDEGDAQRMAERDARWRLYERIFPPDG